MDYLFMVDILLKKLVFEVLFSISVIFIIHQVYSSKLNFFTKACTGY
jgi:hypothetical protein